MNKRYFVLQYGNRQWRAEEGAFLNVDLLNTNESHVMMDCVYDSTLGICETKLKCEVVKPEVMHEKIVIWKYKRRHNSEKKIGFRPKSTLIKVTGGN